MDWHGSPNTNVRDHRNSETKHYQTDSDGELDPMRTKDIRPVVDHAGYERFHDAKFTVDTKYLCGKTKRFVYDHLTFV